MKLNRYSNCKILNRMGPTECNFCTYKEINIENEK